MVSLAAELLPYGALSSDETVGEWLPPRLVELRASLPPPVIIAEEQDWRLIVSYS